MTQGNPFSTPFVIGHRGAKGLAPENTIPSIRRAALEGARWIEIDVKLSADNVPIVIHDDTVDRTTDGEGPVAELSWDTLQRLDAGGWFDPDFDGTGIPSLKEVLDMLEDLRCGVNIEFKPCPGRSEETTQVVCELLMERQKTGLPPILLSSFDSHCLRLAKDMAKSIPRAMLWNYLPDDWRRTVDEIGATSVHLWDRELSKPTVNEVLGDDFPVRVFTVNDPARADMLRSWGVQSVFTDMPNLIKD